ncbi:hypothetical protein [Streptomyces sp. NPDC005012]|uniref:hypothetical protein n=1 Tax=Streptomyces sp. NPDC005012 TaxID=3154558 RepID=UPI0033B6AD17
MNERPDEQSLGSGLGPDEAELRRLLHQAVEDLEPQDDTLDYLRRAVPARRARKRQALVGVAAAALFAGTAVPTALHVSSAGSAEDVRAGGAAGSPEVQGGQGDDLNTGAGGAGRELPGLPGVTEDVESPGADSEGSEDGGSEKAPAAAPACTAAQLSVAAPELGAVGGDGSVPGVFRVYNSSIAGCAVTDPGTVSVTAQGDADPMRVSVARQAGEGEVERLLLGPGQSYLIRVSWVPSASCPSTDPVDPPPTTGSDGGTSGGTDSGTTAPPTVGGGTDGRVGATGGDSTADGVTAQLGTARTNSGGGSVLVTYHPQGSDGAATPASLTIPGACAGTVYRTGIVAGG